MTLDLATVTRADCAPHLGEAFRIRAGGDSWIEARLIEAEEWGTPAVRQAVEEGRRRRMPFRLVFRGPADRLLPQGIHRVERDGWGALEPFLVPVGPDGEGMLYEAVFT